MAFAAEHYGAGGGFGASSSDKWRSAILAASLQGAGITALLLIPAAIIEKDEPDPPTRIITVTPDPVPPKPKPIEKIDKPTNPKVRTTKITAPDPIITLPTTLTDVAPTILDGPVEITPLAGDGTGVLDGVGDDIAPVFVPVPEPLLVKPKLDLRYKRQFQPAFPSGKLRAGIEGAVKVRVLVGTNGRAKAVEQISATDADFFRATQRHALRKWRFTPATKDGTPIEEWMTVSVNFTIHDK